jgi:hypothetical protein
LLLLFAAPALLNIHIIQSPVWRKYAALTCGWSTCALSGLSLPQGDLNLYHENQDSVRLATYKSSTLSKPGLSS